MNSPLCKSVGLRRHQGILAIRRRRSTFLEGREFIRQAVRDSRAIPAARLLNSPAAQKNANAASGEAALARRWLTLFRL